MNTECERDEDWSGLRRQAPPGFVTRVMANLPEDRRGTAWWPSRGQWLAPALAGALLAMLALGLGWWRWRPESGGAMVVHFEIHAPGARQVELVGSFTDWQTDRIELRGPDASGHWTAEVPLPPGRHEYLFLVDGQSWVTDPRAEVRRADGFGRENAVLAL